MILVLNLISTTLDLTIPFLIAQELHTRVPSKLFTPFTLPPRGNVGNDLAGRKRLVDDSMFGGGVDNRLQISGADRWLVGRAYDAIG